MASAVASCSAATTIPASLAVPTNISAFVLPGTDPNDPALDECCDGYPVSVVDSCYLWCQVPDDYVNGTLSRQNNATDVFKMCLNNYDCSNMTVSTVAVRWKAGEGGGNNGAARGGGGVSAAGVVAAVLLGSLLLG